VRELWSEGQRPTADEILKDLTSAEIELEAVAEYVRAWAFEAALKRFFREKFGSTWFTRRDAGSLVRELWSEGQRPTADEILKDLTSAEIELEAVSEYVRESLAA
jgi:hypothetical protein